MLLLSWSQYRTVTLTMLYLNSYGAERSQQNQSWSDGAGRARPSTSPTAGGGTGARSATRITEGGKAAMMTAPRGNSTTEEETAPPQPFDRQPPADVTT